VEVSPVAYYLVRARPRLERLAELGRRLSAGEFRSMRPFGNALTHSLLQARLDPDTGEAVWEAEDYCTPPLAMERAAVLDRYFDALRVEPVGKGEGWSRVRDLPSLWTQRGAG
jgi:hypothetical protein